jgi:hypothetical protein
MGDKLIDLSATNSSICQVMARIDGELKVVDVYAIYREEVPYDKSRQVERRFNKVSEG